MLPNIIDTVENCDLLFETLKNEPVVALDSEFVWTRSYFPYIGIIQIGVSPERSYLLDTVKLYECPQSFKDFLKNKNVLKVFHDAYQDVKIVNYYAKTVSENILDTQLAAAFTGFGRAAPLSKLVEDICGVTLSKAERLTNWLQRPLTGMQIEYALNDVRYLTDCASHLIAKAKENGVWDWIKSDCDESLVIEKPFDLQTAARQLYEKECRMVQHKNRLKLYRLCFAVEAMAEQKNLPRSFLFTQGQLAQIINCNPENPKNLKKTSLTPKAQERFANFIAESINNENVNLDKTGARRTPDRNIALTSALVKEIGAIFDAAALQKGISPSRVYSRKEITALVRNTLENNEIAQLEGWRNVFLGEIWNEFWKNQTLTGRKFL